MFWGLILKTNKKYSQTVQKAFHLSQAALDLSKSNGGDVQVMLTSEENTYLLCTLGKDRPQVALDLNFEEGDQISLATKGDGMVHLTGYLVPSEEDMFGGLGDDEEDEEELEDEVPAKNGKAAAKQDRIAKKVAQKVNAKEVQLEEGDEDDMDETFELPKGAKKQGQKGGAAADSDDDDDDEDEDDDDEDDSDDEGLDESKADGEDDDDDDDDDDDEDDDDEDDDDDEEDDSEDEQPKAKVAKVDKKAPKQNGVENGKASSKELKKEEKSAGQKEEAGAAGKTRTLQGGLVVEDLKVGGGAEAKPGKKVAVYYEGRLKKNNKVFDSTAKGPGFKFALGRGEVIKGWDLGVAGMKVGGKRRLTVPHQLAYGTRGSPPVIPPNSTLVFDVELKNVF